jgi:putative flippase GtrA
MNIKFIFKKNYLRYIKYTLVGTAGFFIMELFTFLLYPILPDIIAVFIALSSATVAGYLLSRKYVVNKKKGNFSIYLLTTIGTIIFMDSFQWFLLINFNINPITGNIVASIIINPLDYIIQMIKVWGISIA